MPNYYIYAAELLLFIIFFLCLYHAWKSGWPAVLQLLAEAAFGVLLELATIRQLEAYSYGPFAVMVFDVPLVIGLAWGSMIYTARLFSEATNLPEWARPLLDALLVLNIDLSMDAIAIRLGMWNWGHGLQFQYFGVPYANFWAWFWVVFCFSAGLRLFVSRWGWIGRWLAPFIALGVGLLGVVFTNQLITYSIPVASHEIAVGVVILASLVIVLVLRPRLKSHSAALAGWVPLIMHLYFLAAGLISGILLNIPFLLAVSLAMLFLSVFVHRPFRPKARSALATD
jgi:hypothetical protein